MIECRKEAGQTRANPLPDGITFADDFDIDAIMHIVKCISYYFRDSHNCPWAAENWILNFKLKDGNIYCIRYDKDMSEQRFMEYLKPLVERMRH